MRIQTMELFQVPPRWLFLKMTTDDGLAGWGEPVVEGKAATVQTAVEEMSDFLIGKDPAAIEDLWQTLYRGGFYRGGPVLMSAISGIEQALWDIKGQRLGVPVYDLLGGAVRDRVQVYAWIGGDAPAELIESARERIAAGYSALKMNATAAMGWVDTQRTIVAAAERLAALRDAIGYDIEIGIDFHGRVHKPMAKGLMQALEPYRPMFFEEPLLPQHNDALPELARHTAVPIATGERMFTRWDFKALLASGGVDVVQPDLSHTGGIWEARKIAAMAEAYDVAVAPHCPLGPIALAASLQLDFCTPNAFIQEQVLDIHAQQGAALLDYLVDPSVFRYDAGYVLRPAAPGLGIAIDEAKVRAAAAVGHRWRTPLWRNADGSVAEW
jgi:galactonate dehydratase